jgi:AAA ATPase-like protein
LTLVYKWINSVDMDPVRNPFVPGAGAQPPELTGREELLERARITLERIRIGRASKSFIAVGLRGVGKTVMLNRVRQMADQRGFRVCLIEAHEHTRLPELLVPQLRRQLLDLDRLGTLDKQVKRALRVLASFVSKLRLRYGEVELSLDIDPEPGSADSGDVEVDLPELFAALGEAAASRQSPVALLLDEIQYLSPSDMSALIMSIHRVAQQGLPVTMIAAGLPQVVGLTGRSKSYAERLFDFPTVDALRNQDAMRALAAPAQKEGVRFETDALEKICDTTKGYPYFLQEWGYHTWNVAEQSPINRRDVTRATRLALQRLDESFFRVRFDRLTPREKEYLRAMAALGPGPHRSGDIAEQLGVSVQSVGPLRSGLIGKGMIYSPAHGDTAFTVPLFDEFLHRIMPKWAHA